MRECVCERLIFRTKNPSPVDKRVIVGCALHIICEIRVPKQTSFNIMCTIKYFMMHYIKVTIKINFWYNNLMIINTGKPLFPGGPAGPCKIHFFYIVFLRATICTTCVCS